MKEIQLSQGKVALVDDEDYERLMQWKWYTVKHRASFYAHSTLEKLKMHRIVMNAPKGVLVDHIDGNGLNNQKKNLRLCTNSQNLINRGLPSNNTIGYKGVSSNGNTGRFWKAEIKKDDKKIYIGNYKTPEEAAKAYDRKAIELFGEFAWLNFPDDVEPRQISLKVVHIPQKAKDEMEAIKIHRFETKPDTAFPEDRFCAICGEYTLHPSHEHARECRCPRCKTVESLNKIKTNTESSTNGN